MESGTERTRNHEEGWRWKYIFVAAVFAVFTSSIVFIDRFREYEADVTVLSVAKGSGTSSVEAAGNLVVLSRTSAFEREFFSRMNGEHQESYPIRKEELRDVLRVEREDGGSVVHVRFSADDPDIARDLSRKASSALFRLAGTYYDVRKDVDFRSIDGPTVSVRIGSPLLYGTVSLVSGIGVTTLFFSLVALIPFLIAVFDRRKFGEESTVLPREMFEPAKTESPFLSAENLDREEVAFEIEERSAHRVAGSESSETIHESSRRPMSPMDRLQAFSEAEKRFFQEFSFEDDGTSSAEAGMPSEATASTNDPAVRMEPAPIADGKNAVSDDMPGSEPESEPTEEEYRKRLNELLR